MSTAIIGVGNIGKAVATDLTRGGESVVLAAKERSNADQLARELGALASSADVAEAIEQADTVLFAAWFDTIKELIPQHAARLTGKVVIDPSNPVAFGSDGQPTKTLPDGVSAGSVIAGLLPDGAHYVKAFGTVAAEFMTTGANRTPERAVLFYATDDGRAASTVERLISAAGFDPVPAGGVQDAARIEMFGDLHQFGGLNGRLLTADEAQASLAGAAA